MTRFDRINCFQAKLKELSSAQWISAEDREWLAVFSDPDANFSVAQSIDKLLSRSYPIWNEKTGSFCQVPLVFDSATQALQTPKSRPNIRVLGRQMKASRAVFSMGNNLPVGPNTLIRHRCDNPFCLEVDHLIDGDYLDNESDKGK